MSSETTQGAICKNCGAPLQGPYCHKCGQHDFNFHQSFKHVAHEALEDLFHFDGKFFKGIYDLLFRPGWLTNEFNSGRRARHMPPLRLYIFVSLIYFLAPAGDGYDKPDVDDDISEVKKELKLAEKKEPSKYEKTLAWDNADGAEIKKEGKIDGKKASPEDEKSFVWNGKQSKLPETVNDKLDHWKEIKEHFQHYIPKMVLICLPLFALLTRMVFRRGGLNYLQHLVLALHLHSFYFLFSLTKTGWTALFGLFSESAASMLSLACNLYVILYLYLTLRTVFGYEYSRGGIVFRSFLVAFGYTMVLLFAALCTIIIAALMV
jgi:hypothetical protein